MCDLYAIDAEREEEERVYREICKNAEENEILSMIIYLIPRVESSDIFRLQKKRDRRERDRRTHIGISILILRVIRTFPLNASTEAGYR